MYDAIQLGPLTIQYFLIIAVLSFLLTYFILEAFLKDSQVKQFFQQHYWTIVFILFITYKFSIVLFRPKLLLTNSWLFLSGGEKGIFLGFLFSIIYIIWRGKRSQVTFKTVFIVFGQTVICFSILYQLIKILVLSIF
ncbi:hypothetical protein [Metabacillus litoralis]|uniref:hypothetical protein n=1 Tax=Metabacillus litoralis TaxID=152268 RepID=UPI001CFDF25B|nr:hypothetical protein [Metabacillus litoralis]